MLYVVLGLVLVAFGLLIAALTTANTLFAWLSVAVSVIAAGLLVFDWVKGRRRARDAREAAVEDGAEAVPARADQPFGDQTPPFAEMPRGHPMRDRPAVPARAEAEPAALLAEAPARTPDRRAEPDEDHAAESYPPAFPEEPPEERPAERTMEHPAEPPVREPVAEETGEPDEEQTDAADLLVVADLNDEVRVVDEHPRYHLVSCTYLYDKPTIPLPVAEARQLGFTPCVRCGPDATLAARHRASR